MASALVGFLSWFVKVGENGRLLARGSFFDESRNSGTPLQINNTGIGQIAFGGDGQLGALDPLPGRLYGSAQAFDQNFSAVAQTA
jgi:hypothetical protein